MQQICVQATLSAQSQCQADILPDYDLERKGNKFNKVSSPSQSNLV
jgi:hypothetical protein